MKNRIMAGMVILLLIVGCATMMSFEEKEKIYGKEASVITETYPIRCIKKCDLELDNN